jgi:hypothetical protein
MTDIRCPICNRSNNENADRCWYCQAELHPSSSPETHPEGDWLDGLRGETDPSTESAAPDTPTPTPEPPQEEVPDWLARIRQRARSEKGITEDTSEAFEPLDSLESQDSNKELQGSSDIQPLPAQKSSSAEPTSEPSEDEWLKQLQSWQDQPTPEVSEPAKDQSVPSIENNETQETPSAEEDWLQRFSADAGTDEPTASSNSQPEVPENSSENESEDTWLSSFKKLSPESDLSDQIMPAPSEPDPASKPFNTGQLREWLDEPNESEQPAENTHAEESLQQPGEVSSLLEDSLNEPLPTEKPAEEHVQSIPQKENFANPFDDKTDIDWINEAPAVSEVPQEKPAENNALEPAALPAWLQSMLPNKKNSPNQAAPSTKSSSGYREENGPLAGIEGVLQGEEMARYYSKPQAYSGSLKITDSQMERSKILKAIADKEQWVDEGVEQKPRSFRWVLRLVVAVLILGAVFVPMFLKNLPVIQPSLYPQSVINTYDTVNGLEAGKPVLIAADFDSSLYGEMSWSMQPLLSHLMSRNVPIAFLSTNSVGATLMEKTLTRVEIDNPSYPADQLVNLGYLPGGSIGMQNLARDPREAMPSTASIKPAWGANSPLNAVKKLSDFGAVIVVTENPDTVRYWIEQVTNSLGNTPLLVVISAQAAPLVAPYYDSGQITGYLSGLYSAASYETLLGSPQTASQSLASYQAALIVVILIILVGGIVSLIMVRPTANHRKGM